MIKLCGCSMSLVFIFRDAYSRQLFNLSVFNRADAVLHHNLIRVSKIVSPVAYDLPSTIKNGNRVNVCGPQAGHYPNGLPLNLHAMLRNL